MKHILITLALLALAFGVFAHAPGDINASYTASNKTLNISFDHKVADAKLHFIQSIEVRLNDTMIISQVASAQDSAEGGSYIYRIPNLKKNDVLTITLICNKGGKKSASMILK
jgi:hypothetical protein